MNSALGGPGLVWEAADAKLTGASTVTKVTQSGTQRRIPNHDYGAGGSGGRFGRAGGQQDRVTPFGELAAHFAADPAIAAGDQRDGAHFRAHIVDCLHIM